MMGTIKRIIRHLKMFMRSRSRKARQTPPFLVVFINSVCNLTCEHCFYWKNLNQRNDLEVEEFEKLSLELGNFEHLNLSGGEPFIHKQFAQIVQFFIDNNGVKEVYVPTNAYFTERTEKQLRQLLKANTPEQLSLFVCEISLDGTQAFHDEFRGNPKSFSKAMETYDMLAELQKEDSRLQIHCISTATDTNMKEIWDLTEFLYERCPAMDHHNLAIIRGDRKDPSLQGPSLNQYEDLYQHIAKVWKAKEEERYGSIVEPMLQWGKLKVISEEKQSISCTAGNMTGVVYANGDVSLCEIHEPIGNLRDNTFFEIWDSKKANVLRAEIEAKKCHCTTEVFLWPSIVYQPIELMRAFFGIRNKWKSQ